MTDGDDEGTTTDPETLDELAGIVDLFGALTRTELETALDELAFKQGREADAASLSAAIDDALAAYYLVEYDRDEGALLSVGPVAFPTLPPDAEDLPHIMDVEARAIDRGALAEQVEARLRADAARAVQAGDDAQIAHLLDVTYDIEAWAPVDAGDIRTRLDAALDGDDTAEGG